MQPPTQTEEFGMALRKQLPLYLAASSVHEEYLNCLATKTLIYKGAAVQLMILRYKTEYQAKLARVEYHTRTHKAKNSCIACAKCQPKEMMSERSIYTIEIDQSILTDA